MAFTFAAALRRAKRMMRPAKLTRATRSIQKAMTGLMVKSALAPLAKMKPKSKKIRKTATPKVGRALGAVLQHLRAAQLLVPGAKRAASATKVTPRVPKGAQYLTRSHRNSAGSRGYKIFIPTSQPKGLILMLHGCNQTPDDFAVGTHMNALGERHGLVIAYPAQTPGHNAAACWNWFKPGHQTRGTGEPAILASLARKLTGEFGLGREAVFVAGLSAGGAMAAILADIYPDVFAAAGIHSGLARGAAQDVVSAMSAMRNGAAAAPSDATSFATPTRRIIFQGDSDSTVHSSNAGQIVSAALGSNAVPTRITRQSARGRDYARSTYAAADGAILLELWMLQGTGHAWSGGRVAGSYTDAKGPDASAQMVRFFLAKSA